MDNPSEGTAAEKTAVPSTFSQKMQKIWWVWAIIALIAVIALAFQLISSTFTNANPRIKAIEDYVSLSEELFPGLFTEDSITFADSGDFVEIKRVHDSDNVIDASTLGYIYSVAEDQLTIDMLAAQIGCPVIICDYLKDDYLFSVQVGYPDESTRQNNLAPKGKIEERLDEISQAADDFAIAQREQILNARCEEILAETTGTGEHGYAEASYSVEPGWLWINVIQSPGFGFQANMTDQEYAAVVEDWREYAKRDTLLLRQNVGYRFYTSDGELDLEASSEMDDYYMNPRSEG